MGLMTGDDHQSEQYVHRDDDGGASVDVVQRWGRNSGGEGIVFDEVHCAGSRTGVV